MSDADVAILERQSQQEWEETDESGTEDDSLDSDIEDDNASVDGEEEPAYDRTAQTAQLESLRQFKIEVISVEQIARKAKESALAAQYLVLPAFYRINIGADFEQLAIRFWPMYAKKFGSNKRLLDQGSLAVRGQRQVRLGEYIGSLDERFLKDAEEDAELESGREVQKVVLLLAASLFWAPWQIPILKKRLARWPQDQASPVMTVDELLSSAPKQDEVLRRSPMAVGCYAHVSTNFPARHLRCKMDQFKKAFSRAFEITSNKAAVIPPFVKKLRKREISNETGIICEGLTQPILIGMGRTFMRRLKQSGVDIEGTSRKSWGLALRTAWRKLTSAGYKGEKRRLQDQKNQELNERNEERKRQNIVDDVKREENLARLAERAAAAGVQPRRKAQFGKIGRR
ncbi:hypothetical protein QFC21_006532 [Naganishia friedmannii]|uniref:Uncharacterized protein n=1 Tax=Naganishia friedmannii TaxID=89922 RepID=A0ACC2V329_9TREE|nr:hypothetical protein QFC21_006532 [Naganishia friedmannii]